MSPEILSIIGILIGLGILIVFALKGVPFMFWRLWRRWWWRCLPVAMC